MTPLPADAFIQVVDGSPDLFKFRFDFSLEGKAADDPIVTELEDGDLLIEGFAAVWEGDDRQGENFAPGAFQAGIQKFLSGQAALCYHHKHDKCLGKVLDLREEGKGLKMRARVDGAIQTHPELGTIYKQIKKGTYNGLSTYGFFTRKENKIVGVDLTEISVTPVPVHPGTSLSVLAGKALASDLKDKAEHVVVPDFPAEDIREDDFLAAEFAIETLDRLFERISKRNTSPTDAAPAE